MKKRRLWQLLIPAVLLVLVIVIGVLPKNGNGNQTISNLIAKVDNLGGLKKWGLNGTLVYKSGDKINYYSLESSKDELYTNDTKAISGSISEGGTLLALGAKRQKWNKGKEVADINALELPESPLPVISPKGDQIAYLTYSNAERDFGNNLMIVGSGDAQSYYSSEKQIQFLNWADNNTIIFVVKDNINKIVSLDISSKKVNEITQIKQDVASLSANKNSIAVVTNDTNRNLIIVDRASNKQSTVNGRVDGLDVTLSPDAKSVAYINGDGKVEIINISDGNKRTLSKADKIIGWY